MLPQPTSAHLIAAMAPRLPDTRYINNQSGSGFTRRNAFCEEDAVNLSQRVSTRMCEAFKTSTQPAGARGSQQSLTVSRPQADSGQCFSHQSSHNPGNSQSNTRPVHAHRPAQHAHNQLRQLANSAGHRTTTRPSDRHDTVAGASDDRYKAGADRTKGTHNGDHSKGREHFVAELDATETARGSGTAHGSSYRESLAFVLDSELLRRQSISHNLIVLLCCLLCRIQSVSLWCHREHKTLCCLCLHFSTKAVTYHSHICESANV